MLKIIKLNYKEQHRVVYILKCPTPSYQNLLPLPLPQNPLFFLKFNKSQRSNSQIVVNRRRQSQSVLIHVKNGTVKTIKWISESP
jgi:hypothetical protein